jgi:hypothetical protein
VTFDGECLELNDQYSIGDAAREGARAILGAALASAQSGAPVVPRLPILDCEPVPLPLEAARRLYADTDAEDLAERPAKAHTRFGGLNASQGSVLPEINYWDAERLLPRIPGEGCVGYMIGDTGSHKTGTAIMLALNAIEEKGARVLYIAAEGGRGVQTKRVPKAWQARGHELAMLDPYWRVETADFDLTSAQDRRELDEAYASFAPDLVFVDVMTLVAGGANINETKDATALRAAAAELARRFGGATVVLIHHPNKQGMKGDSAGIGSGSGSATLYQLAYFQLDVRYEEKRGVVKVYVWKMKDEERGRWLFFKNASHAPRSPLADRVPVIRRMTAEEAREYDGKADGPPRCRRRELDQRTGHRVACGRCCAAPEGAGAPNAPARLCSADDGAGPDAPEASPKAAEYARC